MSGATLDGCVTIADLVAAIHGRDPPTTNPDCSDIPIPGIHGRDPHDVPTNLGSFDIPVPGAELGDFALASCTAPLTGGALAASVERPGVVSVVLVGFYDKIMLITDDETAPIFHARVWKRQGL